MDRKTIDDFGINGRKLLKAIAGLSAADLLWVPPPGAGIGKWTIQQVALHLMDDELIWTARMKSIIAENEPKILGYDESKFAADLYPAEQDAGIAARILDLNRRQFVPVLQNLPEEAFSRKGRHNDIGLVTLEQCIVWTDEHLDHHVHYIKMKRDRLGKPLEE